MSDLLRWIIGKPKEKTPKQIMYTPDGKAKPSDECYMCKRRPEIYEDAFTIWFGKIVCEYCFWSDEWFNENHPDE